MSAMKRLYEDIYEFVKQGLDNYDISRELCLKYGFSLEEDGWLTKQIQAVRIEEAKEYL